MTDFSNNIHAWGPQVASDMPDQGMSSVEKAIGFGLDKADNYGDPGMLQRRTLTTVMKSLCAQLRKEPLFAHVSFVKAYAEDLAKTPRVVWRLVSRVAGVDGKNHKSPFGAEAWPADDGSVIQKWVWPHTLGIALDVFDESNDGADELAENLENFLTTNPMIWSQAGWNLLHFEAEAEHDLASSGASEPMHKRTLNYTGVINYIYTTQVHRIAAVNVTLLDNNYATYTIPIVRGEGESLADLFPVPGPGIALACLHTVADQISEDFFPDVDFGLLIDKQQFGMQFYVHWNRRGKHPQPGDTYYATYVANSPTFPATTVALSEIETEPNPVDTTRRKRRRGVVNRDPIGVEVLGQRVDRQRGQRLVFTQDDTGPRLAGVATSLREALTRAQVEVATVLDTTRIS